MRRISRHKFKHLHTSNEGAVAVETAIIIPLILIPMAIMAADVSIAVNSAQSLTSASRTGAQYLINGGRDETHLKQAIVGAYDGYLPMDNVSINTSCVCPNQDALTNDSDAGNETDAPLSESLQSNEEAEPELPYSTRLVTLATIDQCKKICPLDNTKERVLVDMDIRHETTGIYTNYPIRRHVSVRIK